MSKIQKSMCLSDIELKLVNSADIDTVSHPNHLLLYPGQYATTPVTVWCRVNTEDNITTNLFIHIQLTRFVSSSMYIVVLLLYLIFSFFTSIKCIYSQFI